MARTDSCGACHFFEATEVLGEGECRHDHPIHLQALLTGVGPPDSAAQRAIWPIVSQEDWCGEFTEASSQDG